MTYGRFMSEFFSFDKAGLSSANHFSLSVP